MRSLTIVVLLCLLFTGCMVGPNYRRPAVDVPPAYRGETSAQQEKQTTLSLGDQKWWEVFRDPVLKQLIQTALKQNYNLQIAASRVLQVQQQLVATRANEFPNFSAIAQYLSEKIPGLFTFGAFELGGSASWTIDFWGRYRRATEAARASLLESEWSQKAVASTLVSDVASSYFQLRALDLELKIAQDTLAARQQSLQLTNTLYKGGADTLLDVREAEQLVETAAALIPDLERQIAQQENALSILLGENPTNIPRGQSLEEQLLPEPEAIPAGLPSSLLERRPDIRAQEQALIAANANIGAAKAALFPAISLTGTGGFESRSLAHLISSNSTGWTASAGATQPVFNAGALRAEVKITQAQQQQALLSYKQTIQTAFEEVSNALVAYRKYREYAEHEAKLVAAARDAVHLSQLRFQAGATSYLEVLTNNASYLADELALVAAQLNERLALVQLYNALGGGWQQ
jgi:multidrug efflux system outer membrane protein